MLCLILVSVWTVVPARPPAHHIIIVFKWMFLSGASQVVCSMTTLSDLLDQYNIRSVGDGDSATCAMSHV